MTRNIIIDELEARGYKAVATEIVKNGVVLKAIIVGEGMIRPTIYTDQFENWDNVDMAAEKIIEQYESAKRNPYQFNIKNALNWDYAKEHLQLCLQRKSTEDIVKRDFLDLEQYVRVFVTEDGSYKVKSEHLAKLGVSEDELFDAAWICTRKTLMANDMAEIMAEMMDLSIEEVRAMTEDCPQIVITNKDKIHGAIAMCDTDLLAEIAKEYDANLTILPSSIHECIVVPMVNGQRFEELNSMVRQVNETKVLPQEQLSDHAYYYDRRKNVIK